MLEVSVNLVGTVYVTLNNYAIGLGRMQKIYYSVSFTQAYVLLFASVYYCLMI